MLASMIWKWPGLFKIASGGEMLLGIVYNINLNIHSFLRDGLHCSCYWQLITTSYFITIYICTEVEK